MSLVDSPVRVFVWDAGMFLSRALRSGCRRVRQARLRAVHQDVGEYVGHLRHDLVFVVNECCGQLFAGDACRHGEDVGRRPYLGKAVSVLINVAGHGESRDDSSTTARAGCTGECSDGGAGRLCSMVPPQV